MAPVIAGAQVWMLERLSGVIIANRVPVVSVFSHAFPLEFLCDPVALPVDGSYSGSGPGLGGEQLL